MGRYGSSYGYGWKPYVSVAERRRRAAKKLEALRKKGMDVQPVEIDGRKITKTFWGEAWCDHLESFSDYANRLPRGRTYVRNGSVCHLGIAQGEVNARVSGSSLYKVYVQIKKLPPAKWRAIKQRSAGKIGSLLELLRGKLSDEVMQIVTDQKEGLFPLPKEISFRCDCPDWAGMCKHIAAVIYGIGARLDVSPELLFTLRGVDHEELIAVDAEAAVSAATASGQSKQLAASDLSDVFGIDLAAADETNTTVDAPSTTKRQGTATKKSVATKTTKRQTTNGKKTSTTKAMKKKTAKRKKISPTKATKKQTTKRKKATPTKASRTSKAKVARTSVRKKKSRTP